MDEDYRDLSRLVTVFEAESELDAVTIRSFLESQGIPAAVRSRQIPMYDGIARVWNPVWGYVMVLEEDSGTAASLIAEYMESMGLSDPEPEGGNEDGEPG